MARKTKPRFPTKADILEFIESTPGKVTKREIANAFYIKGDSRRKLKRILRELQTEGAIAKDIGQSLRPAGSLPNVLVVEITGTDEYGDVMARPSGLKGWDDKDKPPRIFIAQRKRGKTPALTKGARALVRLTESTDEDGAYYAARIIRVLEGTPRTFIGVFHKGEKASRIVPTDKKNRHVFTVVKGEEGGAEDNALVLAETKGHANGRKTRYLERYARVIENLGDLTQPKSISLIAIHHHGIPYTFPQEVLSEAKAAKPPALKDRVDLRKQPFFTIDPEDARDHDDAVLAVRDDDPKNKGGFKLAIAIADVAHFVRPKSALDTQAATRANSCYFPDRVVPMLPETLSADLCSLVKTKDRSVFVCHVIIDKTGRKIAHRFERALIKCVANITYREVQKELDTGRGEWQKLTKPLYDAYLALRKARDARGPLNLELPERKVILNKNGTVKDVVLRDVLPAHKIIEELMVTANVAAAETLTKHGILCMFRIHEEPSMEKMEALRQFLSTIGLKFSRGQVLTPRRFNELLDHVKNKPTKGIVNEMVLRSQSQAYYSPDNLGHFGLALSKYAHFTSPIRRYSDILVHRALISALKLGKDGLADQDIARFRKIAEDISNNERRAMAAERESTDRYLALFLSERIGETFKARISGVTRFGLFATVAPSGGDGFIPMSTLGQDYFNLDDRAKRLVGRHTGETFKLGDDIDVRLVEADKFSGSLRLEILSDASLPKSLMRSSLGRKRHHRRAKK